MSSIFKKRLGFSIIETVAVISLLTILAGMVWPLVDLSGRVPRDRSMWKDIERIGLATRLYRLERGSFPTGKAVMEASGYIEDVTPPRGYKYIYTLIAPNAQIVVQDGKGNEISDWAGRAMKLVIEP